MKRNLPVLIVLLALAAVIWLRGSPAAVAPAPPMFSEALTLAQADARAAEQSRVVLVVASADWCGFCQQLKREALRDPRVESWVRNNAVPVYIDTDRSPEAAPLRLLALPTILMRRGGVEIGRMETMPSADALLAWASQAVAAPQDPAAPSR